MLTISTRRWGTYVRTRRYTQSLLSDTDDTEKDGKTSRTKFITRQFLAEHVKTRQNRITPQCGPFP